MVDGAPKFYCNKFTDIHSKYMRYDFGDVTEQEIRDLYMKGYIEVEVYDLDLGVTIASSINLSEG